MNNIKKSTETLDILLNNIEAIDIPLKCESMGYVTVFNKDGTAKQIPQKNIKVAIVDELLIEANKEQKYITKDYELFYIFNGFYWVYLEKNQVANFLKRVAMKFGYKEIESKDEAFKDSLLKQLASESFIHYSSTSTNKINLLNGTLEISNEDISLKAFDYRDFLKYQLNFNYDPESKNGIFQNYLDIVLPDKDTQRTLQEVSGYLFIKDLKLELMFFLYGNGSNGKSVFFEILKGVIGDDNITNYSLEKLTDDNGYSRAKLKDKILNYGLDISLGKINPDKVKTLASNEPIEARLPYQEPFIMTNYAKMIFNFNKIENANIEHTHGFYRKLLFIPFNTTIDDSQKDINLHKKILKNKSGVLNWIITGIENVLKNKRIFISKECSNFKDDLLRKSDSVSLF